MFSWFRYEVGELSVSQGRMKPRDSPLLSAESSALLERMSFIKNDRTGLPFSGERLPSFAWSRLFASPSFLSGLFAKLWTRLLNSVQWRLLTISGDFASNESSDFSSPGSMIEECVEDADGLRLGERSRLHIAELNCRAIWNGIFVSSEHCLLALSNSLKLVVSVGILRWETYLVVAVWKRKSAQDKRTRLSEEQTATNC